MRGGSNASSLNEQLAFGRFEPPQLRRRLAENAKVNAALRDALRAEQREREARSGRFERPAANTMAADWAIPIAMFVGCTRWA